MLKKFRDLGYRYRDMNKNDYYSRLKNEFLEFARSF